jgi:DNA-binding CsgD family transcriptional regulator
MTSPSGILATAPRALCEGSPFRRALLSVVRDGQLIAESVHDPGDAEAVLNELRAAPVPLEPPLIEVELLRRRRPALVSAADGQRRTAAPMGWRSFVAAPLLYGSRAVGILHADRGPTEPVEVHDRDTLWEFASTLSAAYESASLRRTLRRERQEMRRFLEWLNARSGTLNDARITLAGRPDVPALDAERRGSSAPVAGRDDRLVFADLLTSRELDVLRLLADGNSNRDVADMLVLSGATVKFHVNNILKRLHVSNRAEAVSRYLSLLGLPSP